MKACFAMAAMLLAAGEQPVGAQALQCRLARRADFSYAGACVLGGLDTVISHLRLVQPPSPTYPIWRGSGFIRGRPLPMAVDGRVGGTFRGNGWLTLDSFSRDTATLQFSFALGAFTIPEPADLQILQRARDLLASSTDWVAENDQPLWIAALAKAMPPTADLSPFYQALSAIASDSVIARRRALAAVPICGGQRRSLLCALYVASLAATGEYWDDRPAMYAVRASILSAGRLQHPLQQFNSQPTTTLDGVHAVLDSAITWITQGKRCSIQRCS